MNIRTRAFGTRGGKRALAALVAAGAVASAFSVAPSAQVAGAAERPTMVVNSTNDVVFAGPKLQPGAPLTAVKPPYPEECGIGITQFGQSTGASPFSAFCDVIPLSVSLPANIDPADDVRLSLSLSWPVPNGTATQMANPSSNLEMWLWDNRQNLAGKKPVPEFDGTNTKWTPAEVLTEYTMLKAGTGSLRPAVIELENPVLNKDNNGVNYNVLILNFNSQASPQPPNLACPVAGGALGCYVLTAKMSVTRGQSRTEKTEPEVAETPFTPPPSVPTTLPAINPPADLTPVIGPLAPTPTPVDFGATILPPPAASSDEDDTVVLGAVEAAVDPLLESIKSSDLDEELAGPPLETAAAEEPAPIPPSGTAVAVSMVALPVLAAGAVIVFLIRRRSTFRLT